VLLPEERLAGTNSKSSSVPVLALELATQTAVDRVRPHHNAELQQLATDARGAEERVLARYRGD
jgi:hypothetical protein